MSKLTHLQPERVFHYFEEICGIPHGSGDTARISDYCVAFAKAQGLAYHQDALGNVIIKKPATAGYEDHPTVILQGHIDMVCEKAPDCTIDFTTDGLDVDTDGEVVFAHGTTLGGDNGIAVAMAFAVLESTDLSHPPLEVLLTVDEETGMYGAEGLDASLLEGKMLINIDSEAEGALIVGCAGGARAELTLPLTYTHSSATAYHVTVSGLQGGHSGIEIDKGRLNANVVMAQFLQSIDCRLVSIDGGLKDNAIPVECSAHITTDADVYAAAEAFVATHRVDTDPNLTIMVDAALAEREMDAATTANVLELLTTVPNGIRSMSADIEGLVQTSLNLGILTTDDSTLCASFAVRSSVRAEKDALLAKLESQITAMGGGFDSYGHYPAWEYRKDSRLRDTMCAVWERTAGAHPVIVAIHAGLECGLFCEKIEDLDVVSMGPDMWDVHTCRERLSVASTARVYTYLCDVLKEL